MGGGGGMRQGVGAVQRSYDFLKIIDWEKAAARKKHKQQQQQQTEEWDREEVGKTTINVILKGLEGLGGR